MDKNQKVALGVAGVAGGGILLYRRLHPASKTTQVPVSTQGSITPYTPQSPIVLQPGESIYDPNTGGLLNTPATKPTYSLYPYYTTGVGDVTAPPAANPSQPSTPQATAPSAPGYTINVKLPKRTGRQKLVSKASKRKPSVSRGNHNKTPKAPPKPTHTNRPRDRKPSVTNSG